MELRKLLRVLHRDIGYFAVGLTVIFAVSGIAVNHIHQWNPNYSIENKIVPIEIKEIDINEGVVHNILEQLMIMEKPSGWHRTTPELLQIFLKENTIAVNLKKQEAHIEQISPRPILREFNILHLNEPKQVWTWFSDLYAVSLIFLALSGIFLIKGPKGWKWRGTWMVTVGIIVPILFLIYYQ